LQTRVRTVTATQPAFELVQSKLRPPYARAGSVSRARLVDAVERSGTEPLVAVSAGPGWGKTTLLAQWAARSERPFAWVSVDARDNDPIVFLSYVAAALDRISPLDPGVFDALATPSVSVDAIVVPRLGAALAGLEQPVVLALDDLHRITEPRCLNALASLVRHVPEGSQIALSARGKPVLGLGALRAQGLALELGPDDLRMDQAEARELLVAAGIEAPDEGVAELMRQTEGWAAGLYLAALAMRARGAFEVDAKAIAGTDRGVYDYLTSELLAELPADTRRFMVRSAVLERLTGPLCDAVLEATDSAAVLDSLAESNMFLVPLDPHRESYRYHHLFQEVLVSELRRSEPAQIPALLGRAADWCEQTGELEAALGYAHEAEDVERAAGLTEALAYRVYQSGRVVTADRWLRWAADHGALETNAGLAVLGAMLCAIHGRPAEADRWSDAAELGIQSRPLLDGSESVESWRAVFRALRCARGVRAMHADAESATSALARDSLLYPTALLMLGVSQALLGDVDRADDVLSDATEAALAAESPETAMTALAERAVTAIDRGAWVEADDLAERALRIARDARMDEYPATALPSAVRARIRLHRGEAERAQPFLARAQRLRTGLTYAIPWVAAQARIQLAHAYLSLADSAGARTVLREVDGLLRRQAELGTVVAEVERLKQSLETMRTQAPGASTLTAAELRVVPLLATHLSFPEIAERLFISRNTVKTHAMAVYRKLGVSSRGGAVERATQLGLL
jgi:LuxR family maltose regulon positive regulatory protein